MNELIKLEGELGNTLPPPYPRLQQTSKRQLVDGNVYRVLARYFGIDDDINSTTGKKTFRKTADELLNMEHPALHNQAMMELGAVICKPKEPGLRYLPC